MELTRLQDAIRDALYEERETQKEIAKLRDSIRDLDSVIRANVCVDTPTNTESSESQDNRG